MDYHIFYRGSRNHVLFAPLQQFVCKNRTLSVRQEKAEGTAAKELARFAPARTSTSERECGRDLRKGPNTRAK